MTIRLHDNQGRDWTVEGDWSAQVVGADFGGNGAILMWMRPSGDGYLEPAEPPPPAPEELESRPARSLPSGD